MTPERFSDLLESLLNQRRPGLNPLGWKRVGSTWYDTYEETDLQSMDATVRAAWLYVWAGWLMQEHGLKPMYTGTVWEWHSNGQLLAAQPDQGDAIAQAMCLTCGLAWSTYR
ncbi:MAG: hypothetical protein AAGI53_01635 [Planctomycetota bacterium]